MLTRGTAASYNFPRHEMPYVTVATAMCIFSVENLRNFRRTGNCQVMELYTYYYFDNWLSLNWMKNEKDRMFSYYYNF